VSQSQSPKWKRADTQPRSNWQETFVISIDYHFERFPVFTRRSSDSIMADIDVLSSFAGGKLNLPESGSEADKKARNESSAEVLSLFFSLGCMQLGQVTCHLWAKTGYS